MRAQLPAGLAAAREAAAAFAARGPERAMTAAAWAAQVDAASLAVPAAIVEDAGETVRLGGLSPGCVACKNGTWDCVFMTPRCNLSCEFCLSPHDTRPAPPHSAMGADAGTLAARYAATGVTGVSFSGGEPLLEPDVLVEWVRALRDAVPNLYLWAYTNGTLLTSELLRLLAEAGLDELRFNVAATGYADAHVERMLAEAAAVLPAVAVEVPAVPAQRDELLGSLGRWAETGVRYLNLHELVHEAGTNSAEMTGARVDVEMPDGHRCGTDPRSADVTLSVLERVAEQGIPLAVNDCALRNKARQIRGRRRLLSPLTLRPEEEPDGDGRATSVALFRDSEVEYVRPSEWEARYAEKPASWSAVRVTRQLPLDLESDGDWVGFEPLAGKAVGR